MLTLLFVRRITERFFDILSFESYCKAIFSSIFVNSIVHRAHSFFSFTPYFSHQIGDLILSIFTVKGYLLICIYPYRTIWLVEFKSQKLFKSSLVFEEGFWSKTASFFHQLDFLRIKNLHTLYLHKHKAAK